MKRRSERSRAVGMLGDRADGPATSSSSLLLRWAPTAAIGLVAGAAWSPMLRRLVTEGTSVRVLGINDYPLHMELADRFSLLPYVNNSPHFLFHALTAFWGQVLSLPSSAVLTLSLMIAGTFVAVVVLLVQKPQSGSRLPIGIANGIAFWYLLAETPALLALQWGAIPASSPIYTLHWWGNPTWMVALPFLVLTVPLIEKAIESPGSSGPNQWESLLFAVTLAGALAKPALAIPLVPGLPVYLLLVRQIPWRRAVRVTVSCALPAAAVVMWQFWFLATSSASEFSSGVTVEFLVDAPFGWSNVGAAFALPFIFPVIGMVVAGREYWRDNSIRLLFTLLLVAVPLMLLVNETGERAVHGNFAVPTQACMALLILVSVRVTAITLLRRVHERRTRPAELCIVLVIALTFTAGGVLSYLDGVGAVSVPIDWIDAI